MTQPEQTLCRLIKAIDTYNVIEKVPIGNADPSKPHQVEWGDTYWEAKEVVTKILCDEQSKPSGINQNQQPEVIEEIVKNAHVLAGEISKLYPNANHQGLLLSALSGVIRSNLQREINECAHKVSGAEENLEMFSQALKVAL